MTAKTYDTLRTGLMAGLAGATGANSSNRSDIKAALDLLVSIQTRAVDEMEALQKMVNGRTERQGQAVVLMWDDEDGFWVSSVDCGCRHHPVKDLTDRKHKTLSAAVKAAVNWHNEDIKKWSTHQDQLEIKLA